jgi:hypothetical protein
MKILRTLIRWTDNFMNWRFRMVAIFTVLFSMCYLPDNIGLLCMFIYMLSLCGWLAFCINYIAKHGIPRNE